MGSEASERVRVQCRYGAKINAPVSALGRHARPLIGKPNHARLSLW